MIPLKSCVRCKGCKHFTIFRKKPSLNINRWNVSIEIYPPPPPHTLCIDFSWICLTGMCTLVKICQKDRKQLKTEYSTCTTLTFLIVNTGIQKINSKNNLQFHLFTPNRLIKNLQFVKRHGNHLFHSLNHNEVSLFDEFYD